MDKGKLLNWWEPLPPFAKVLLTIVAIPSLMLNIWVLFNLAEYFHSLLAVLAGASLLAFLLNYPVSFMERQGANRERAALLVFLLALTILLTLGVTLVPIVWLQARELISHLPQWFESGRQQLSSLNDRFQSSGLPFSLDAIIAQSNSRLESQVQEVSKDAINVAVVTVTSLLDGLLTLVLSFYLLQHGKEIWLSLLEWLPERLRQPFSETLRLSFQNFFQGQLILASCMGFSLTVVFLVLQVPFGLLFGLAIGVMSLVPLGGTVGIISVTLLVALQNFSLGLKVLIACVLVQQILENLVGPRILGKMTGLNPVWVFISILTGARIAGLLGVIIAVPFAVVIKSALVAVRSSEQSPPLNETPPQLPPLDKEPPHIESEL